MVKESFFFFQLGVCFACLFVCLVRELNDSSDLVSLRTAVSKGIYPTCCVEFILLFQDAFMPLPQNVFPYPYPSPQSLEIPM